MRAALVLTLALLPRLVAAEITVQASLDPPQLAVGEAGELSVEVRGSQEAAPPAIPAVDGLSIRYVGPSTQVSVVNGRMSASLTHRFSVVPSRAGTFTIGPIAVAVAGRRYEAGVVTVTVGARTAAGQPGAEQLRLELSAPKTEVYLHERLPVTVKLSIGDVRVGDLQFPAVPGDGFALDKFPQPAQRNEQTPTGTVHVVEFRSTLTPVRSGSLAVGPATLSLSMLVRGRSRDLFGFFGESARPVEVQSQPLSLTVLPLPDAGRPGDFSGAVGRFDLDVRVAPSEVNAGDPVTVTSTIRGDGYLDGVSPPEVAARDDLRVYPVQPASAAEGAAERVFEQVVIPQRAGALGLPEMRFSYFDPEARAYRTATRPALLLTVRPPLHPEPAPQIAGAVPERAQPESLGRDLVFVKDDPGRLRRLGNRLHRHATFWVLQLLPLAVWIGAVVYDRRRQRLTGDVRYARYTRAGRAARRALGEARAALRSADGGVFYDRVAQAVRDYLAAKLDLPPGGVTPEAVAARLGAAGVSGGAGADVEALFAACERARFAPPGNGGPDMERTLSRAEAIVRALERERRLGRTLALWAIALIAARAATAAENPQAAFFRGNALYAQERYAEAAAEYERIIQGGSESGNVYFNLGNAYFKAGDPGRAMLAWERARRLLPRDPDVAANLKHGRGDDDAVPVYARLLFPLAHRLSSDELWLATSIFWTALLLVLAVARVAPQLARTTRPVTIGLGVLLAVCASSAVYRFATMDLPEQAVVIAAEDTAVRFEPSPTGTVHFQAKPGTVLRVLAAREGWAQVARADGRRGWIACTAVATL